MLRSCAYCGRIHDSRFDCGRKPIRKKIKYSKADYFRRTQAWTDKAIEIKRRDNYLCQVCIRKRYNTLQQYNHKDLSVHHAIGINQDWSKRLDNDNLITLCSQHHKACESGEIPLDEVLQIIREQEDKQHNLTGYSC